jgi:hypothetical protein
MLGISVLEYTLRANHFLVALAVKLNLFVSVYIAILIVIFLLSTSSV